jgi:murein L,D-transpeptidase YcbB/YkuD
MKLFKTGLLFILPTLLLVGCGREIKHRALTLDSLSTWHERAYAINSHTIRRIIGDLSYEARDSVYIDLRTDAYYASDSAFLWIDRRGVDSRADSLLGFLRKVPEIGFSTRSFYVHTIETDLQRLRDLNFTDSTGDINHVMARLEYFLTKAYMRYAAGQRFGYVNPARVLNALDKVDTAHDASFRRLFDAEMGTAGPKFLAHAREELRHGDVGTFLRSTAPTDSMYLLFLEGYRQHRHSPEARKWLVNLERCRWRMIQKAGTKYVMVNIPSFELRAVDRDRDSTLTMRICCGSFANKTPLLNSRIVRLELNPYWMVPRSIIRKEIAPHHAGNASYFESHHIKIIDRKTRKQIRPELASAELLLSGEVWLRQDSGEDNSLGRMIFRFPNKFSVYLHDTTQREAFDRTWRGVSHGCIRLERPLDLATFLLPENDELLADKIRISIDIPPVSKEGISLARQTKRPLGNYMFDPPVPLFICYYTLYPDTEGVMCEYPDVYGYDEVIWKQLEMYL